MQNNNKTRYGDTAGITQGTEFKVGVKQQVINHYSIFCDSILESAQDFRDAIIAMNMANEDDTVTIYLNSDGGAVDAGQLFIQAMGECQGDVLVKASGTVASMAAIILSASESFELAPFTSIMFHSASSGYGGPMRDMLDYTEFTKKQLERMMRYYCVGILTKEELADIFENKREIWLTSKDFTERYKRKLRCIEMLEEYVDENNIQMSNIGTEGYVDLMFKMMEEDQKEPSCNNCESCECTSSEDTSQFDGMDEEDLQEMLLDIQQAMKKHEEERKER